MKLLQQNQATLWAVLLQQGQLWMFGNGLRQRRHIAPGCNFRRRAQGSIGFVPNLKESRNAPREYSLLVQTRPWRHGEDDVQLALGIHNVLQAAKQK